MGMTMSKLLIDREQVMSVLASLGEDPTMERVEEVLCAIDHARVVADPLTLYRREAILAAVESIDRAAHGEKLFVPAGLTDAASSDALSCAAMTTDSDASIAP
jgi:hypothetical protein